MKNGNHYLSVLLVCVVVLLLFQMVGMSLGLFDSDYEVNRQAAVVLASPTDLAAGRAGTAFVIAPADEPAAGAVDGLTDLRYAVQETASLTDEALNAQVIVWGHSDLTTAECGRLTAFVQGGGTLIFRTLPATARTRKSVQALTGILDLRQAKQKTFGIRFYSGFLLGGSITYEDMTPDLAWFKLNTGCTVYAVGLSDEQTNLSAETIPLLWRYRGLGGSVFVCQEDFLSTHDGAGFITAMYSQDDRPVIYPVINAQTMTVLGFPAMSNENEALITARYQQTWQQMFYNVLLPDVTSIFTTAGYPLTAMFTGSLTTQAADWQIDWASLRYGAKMIVGRSGEMGLTAATLTGSAASTGLSRDIAALKTYIPAYTITTFCPGGLDEADWVPLLDTDLSEIRTLLLPYDGGMAQGYGILAGRTVLPVGQDALTDTPWSRLMLQSQETATLSSHVTLDLTDVVLPGSEDRDWVTVTKDWADHLSGAWYPFKDLDKTTLTEADRRTRDYLSGSCEYEMGESTVTFALKEGAQDGYFLLRGSDVEVYDCVGCTAKQLEKGCWLIRVADWDSQPHLSFK